MPKRSISQVETDDAPISFKRAKNEYPCPHCDSVLTSKGNLNIHLRYHTGEKPYHCDQCDKSFAEKSTLRKHQVLHNNPQHHCPLCRKSFHRADVLRVHVRYHNNFKPYTCTTCDKSFYTSSHLREHQRIHTGEKPYHCKVCFQDFRHLNSLKVHNIAFHTKKGEQKRRKEEHSVQKALTNAEISFDREVSVNYDCFDDNDKNHARIDFVVDAPQRGCRFLVEVDEHQHKGYPVSCELSRMCQVNEAIRMAGQMEKLIWIRYNPNNFRVDGKPKKVSPLKRQERLMEFLNTYVPTQEVEVCYMYYDMDHKGGLSLLEDPDFNPTFEEFITKCIT